MKLFHAYHHNILPHRPSIFGNFRPYQVPGQARLWILLRPFSVIASRHCFRQSLSTTNQAFAMALRLQSLRVKLALWPGALNHYRGTRLVQDARPARWPPSRDPLEMARPRICINWRPLFPLSTTRIAPSHQN